MLTSTVHHYKEYPMEIPANIIKIAIADETDTKPKKIVGLLSEEANKYIERIMSQSSIIIEKDKDNPVISYLNSNPIDEFQIDLPNLTNLIQLKLVPLEKEPDEFGFTECISHSYPNFNYYYKIKPANSGVILKIKPHIAGGRKHIKKRRTKRRTKRSTKRRTKRRTKRSTKRRTKRRTKKN